VTNIGVLNTNPWRARLGACCPRSAFLGTSVSGAAVMAQLGQITNYNHMTSVYAFGEGASGPPPYREPA
jgi:hypothetical protein